MRYRRIKTRFLFKTSYGFRCGAKIFVGLITALATGLGIAQAAGVTVSLAFVVKSLTLIGLISLLYGLIKSRLDHLPDSILIDDDIDVRYELHYEPKNVCKHFNQETAKYFGRDCIDDLAVESWRCKIPEGFIYLKNERGDPCAALCIFGLRRSFIEQFIKGSVSECDIDQDDVLNLQHSKKSDLLYLAVLIVDQPHSPIGHRRALVTVWATIQYLRKVYGFKKRRKLLVVPINPASENLVKRLGFTILSRAGARKDRHDLYAFDLNPENVSKALQRIGDYSGMCAIKLELEGRAGGQIAVST